MGLYLNQLPPPEVARLKTELAETLIANFCYPRFYDYRINALRTRPIDRSKRQEVWQYLNAVDFNVWGRVDVDSPDFQHQVERLFIHFVQRNRNFFGTQGRKRMADVRTLITNCSLVLAEGVRKHLQGRPGNPPLGSPRPVFSWGTLSSARTSEPSWEQMLSSTMQLQQQLQEVRGEGRVASTPTPAVYAEHAPNGSARRPRSTRPTPTVHDTASVAHPESQEGDVWPTPPPSGKMPKVGDGRLSVSFSAVRREPSSTYPAGAPTTEATPTMPLPLSKPEPLPPTGQSVRGGTESAVRPRRPKVDTAPSVPSARPLSGSLSQPLPNIVEQPSTPQLPTVAAASLGAELVVQSKEQVAVEQGDEDVVIFEQMRYQLVVELRVEAVRSGIELGGQEASQLVETLRQQEDVDLARLQVVSTLLNMCDQVITNGRATPFDYKQAMMFYLMHTRRSR